MLPKNCKASNKIADSVESVNILFHFNTGDKSRYQNILRWVIAKDYSDF